MRAPRLQLTRLALAACLAAPAGAFAATAPKQPEKGFGGMDYAVSEVVKRGVGRASAGTYVFHGAGQAAGPRPVVVLFHAWGATNPQVYGGWIEHLARKGHLVLVPRFQELGKTRPGDATANAQSLLKDALAALADDGQARPDLNRVAYIGHSAGAAIALNLAVGAKAGGLPVPKLVFAVMPGGVAKDAKSRGVVLADLAGLDPSTAVVAMSPDREHQASDRTGRRILKEASSVPADRKLFMRVLSDDHGFPALSATLASPASPKEDYDGAKIKLPPDPPGAPPNRQKWSPDMVLTGEQTILVQQLASNPTNSTDWYGFWRPFDALSATAFAGRDIAALRADASFTDTGRWSDGWPVRRLSVEAPRAEASTGEGQTRRR